MADTKLSALTELATTPADDDEVYIRDVSEAAVAESKRILISNLIALLLRKTGGTLTGNLIIEKDFPALHLKATETDGEEWFIEEFVFGGISWIGIENQVTGKALYIANNGQVTCYERLTVASSPVGGDDPPTIHFEDMDDGANFWWIESITPDLKFRSMLPGLIRTPSIRPETDYSKSLGTSAERWKEIFVEHHQITQALGTDHRWSGLTSSMTAGTALTIGQAVYVGGDSKMEKGLATGAATMPAIALATASISENASGEFLMQGFFRDDTWNWTIGGLLYISKDTAGALTQTLPAATGEQVQVVGVAITADIIHFNPSYELVEIS